MDISYIFKLTSTEEAKIAVVKVERVTKRVIVEVEFFWSLHLPLKVCSKSPKQPPQPFLAMHKHHAWLKAAEAHNIHLYIPAVLLHSK